MEFLVVALSAVLLSLIFVSLVFIAFLNFGVFPVPQPDEFVFKLYWRRNKIEAHIGFQATLNIIVLGDFSGPKWTVRMMEMKTMPIYHVPDLGEFRVDIYPQFAELTGTSKELQLAS